MPALAGVGIQCHLAPKHSGRSVCNNLKANPELAKKHLNTWSTKFKGFDYGTLGYADLPSDKRKTAILALITDVQKESPELLKDLA